MFNPVLRTNGLAGSINWIARDMSLPHSRRYRPYAGNSTGRTIESGQDAALYCARRLDDFGSAGGLPHLLELRVDVDGLLARLLEPGIAALRAVEGGLVEALE